MINIVFTGGGTGGHIYPGLAVVEELRSMLDGKVEYKIYWIGSKKGMDKDLVEKSGLVDEFIGITCGKLRRYFSIQNFFDFFKIGIGFISSFFILKRLKPSVVFSKGGFVSVPPCYAAKFLHLPIFTHECDFTPGLATRLNTKVAKNLFVSYSETKENLSSNIKEKTIVSGNPVRPSFFNADKNEGLNFVFGNCEKKAKPILLVVGGSLGAKQINDLVFENIDFLCKNFIVIHQTGKQENLPVINNEDYHRFEFIYSQMSSVMAISDIILSRAGANFLWESMAQNKPMLLIPLGGEGSRGDQLDNAEYFEKKGCAKVLSGENANSENLIKVLSEMNDKNVLDKMSECEKNLSGSVRATKIIADKIFETLNLE